jgi:hypothetical protein
MRYIVFMERGERKEVCEKGAGQKTDETLAWRAAGILGLDAGRGTEDAGKMGCGLVLFADDNPKAGGGLPSERRGLRKS